jgi:uncharacterized SAM-binding protein YcdF (DUF218 family)
MSATPARRGVARRARGCLVVVAATLATAAVLGFVVYQLRAPLLTRIGGLLYHEDALAASDAIAVLSGDGLYRVVEAADLFLAGYAPVVVLSRTPEEPMIVELQARGLDVRTSLEDQLAYLAALGVPQDATTVLERLVDSTQTEAELIAEWAESREIGRLIVVTSGFHTSRARLVFDRVLRGRSTEVLLRASTAPGFDPATWWHDRASLSTGLFELEKYVYYRFMYLLRQTP